MPHVPKMLDALVELAEEVDVVWLPLVPYVQHAAAPVHVLHATTRKATI